MVPLFACLSWTNTLNVVNLTTIITTGNSYLRYHKASWGLDRVFCHGRWEVISVGLHKMQSKWNGAIIVSDIRASCMWSRLIAEWTHWLSCAGRRCFLCQEVIQTPSVFCKLIVDGSDMNYTYETQPAPHLLKMSPNASSSKLFWKFWVMKGFDYRLYTRCGCKIWKGWGEQCSEAE